MSISAVSSPSFTPPTYGKENSPSSPSKNVATSPVKTSPVKKECPVTFDNGKLKIEGLSPESLKSGAIYRFKMGAASKRKLFEGATYTAAEKKICTEETRKIMLKSVMAERELNVPKKSEEKEDTPPTPVKRYIGSVTPTVKGNCLKFRIRNYRSEIKKANSEDKKAPTPEVEKKASTPKTEKKESIPVPRRIVRALLSNPNSFTFGLYEKFTDMPKTVEEEKKLEKEILALEDKYQTDFDTRNPEHGFNVTNPLNEPSRVGFRRGRKENNLSATTTTTITTTTTSTTSSSSSITK